MTGCCKKIDFELFNHRFSFMHQLFCYVCLLRRRKNKGVESQHNVETTPSTTTPNIELKTPDRSDVYAHVVPSTQHPTNNKSQNDVIYAQPDFSNNPISTLSDSDSSNVRQGKAKSIFLEAPNDVCANAASVS